MSNFFSAMLNAQYNIGIGDRAARDRCCLEWKELPLGPEISHGLADYAARALKGEISDSQLEMIRNCAPHQVGLLRSFVLQMLNCPLPGGPGLGEAVGMLETRFESVVDPTVRPMLTITVTHDSKATVTITGPEPAI